MALTWVEDRDSDGEVVFKARGWEVYFSDHRGSLGRRPWCTYHRDQTETRDHDTLEEAKRFCEAEEAKADAKADEVEAADFERWWNGCAEFFCLDEGLAEAMLKAWLARAKVERDRVA